MTTSIRREIPAESVDVAALRAKFETAQASVAILGMGYVGLPLAIAAHARGYAVIGFDIDAQKVAMLEAGRSYLKAFDDASLAAMNASGRFHPTADAARLRAADALLLCVPTPLSKNREPDMSYVMATTEMVARQLRPGQLVVLESTTYPGTTREVMTPILERISGLVAGRDFFIAYSPEREDPGNGAFMTHTIPKVVGADEPAARALAETLYGQIVTQAVAVSSAATAEAVKLTENIFRSVNIALVNELKMVFDHMGIDIWEVVQAASTKPFGYMPFYPGPGVGGHCIPIDPFYLTWKSREYGQPTRFIELAGQINERMPDYVIGRLREALDRHFRRGINGARILMLGAAYKKNVEDVRESPALILWEKLEAFGAQVAYHDPFVAEIPPTREHKSLTGRRSLALTPENLAAVDAVLIATAHDGVDYEAVAQQARLVVDTRNAMAGRLCQGVIVKA